MSDAWEPATAPRRRWPLALGLAAAVVAAAILARPGTEPAPDGTLTVDAASEDPEAQEPTAGPVRPAPGTGSAGTVAAIREASGEWVEFGDAPIDVPPIHLGVWTGTEFVVGFQPEVAAYDPAAGTWRRLPDVPDPDRVAPRVVWTGTEVVLLAGATSDGERPAHGGGLRLDLDTGRWRPLPLAPSAPLFEPVAVWTGEEVVVWGGARPGDAQARGEWPVRGSAYRPGDDRWRVIAEAPVERVYFSDGLWTGREVVVWGSHHPPGVQLRTEAGAPFAAAYDPATDTWRRLPDPPLGAPDEAAAVWTGREVLLWGRPPDGAARDRPGIAGAALDPRAAQAGWRLLPGLEAGDGDVAPDIARLATVWDGRRALLYGGYPQSVGLAYTPRPATWRRLPAHRARVHAVAAWTGTEFLLWGGYTATGPDVDLWAFRPVGAGAAACSPGDAESPRAPLPAGWSRSPPPLRGSVPATIAWRETQLLAWSGSPLEPGAYLGGTLIDLATLERRCLAPSPLDQRVRTGSTWTPAGLFVWGGVPPPADGALYDPAAMTWRRLPAAPLELGLPDAVAWTGQEVLVWGGAGGRRGPLGNGAAYDPATDTWRKLPNAPVALDAVDTAWTGEELIVYGARLRGSGAAATRAVGIAYSPATDNWRRLPDHPLSPHASSVAWTGVVLVVWDYLLEAAAYDPVTDAWTPLPRLPLQEQECHPSSAVVDGKVFAWYCGQAALFDPQAVAWQAVDVPADLPGTEPVGAGDAVLFADHRGLWRYAPAPTR